MKNLICLILIFTGCLTSVQAIEYQPWLTSQLKNKAVDEVNLVKNHDGPVAQIDWSAINSRGWFLSVGSARALDDPWESIGLTLGCQRVTRNWQLSTSAEYQDVDGEPVGRINLKAFRSMYEERILGNYQIGVLASRLEPLSDRNLDDGNVYGVTWGKTRKLSLYYWVGGYFNVNYDEGTLDSDRGWFTESALELSRWFSHYRSIQAGLYYGRDETVLGLTFKQGL